MFAGDLYLKASVSSIEVRDLPLSLLFFFLWSCLVEICLDKLDRKGESVLVFPGSTGENKTM